MGISSDGRRRHRAWSEALKREIVAASLAPGSSVSKVARRYDVNANQVFAWRKRYREGGPEAAAPQLVPVMVLPDQPAATAPDDSCGTIEIVLSSGYRILLGNGVEASALRLVLDVLERR